MGPLSVVERLMRLETQINAIQVATVNAKDNVDRRLNEMNELRTQITSERSFYLQRDAYERDHSAMESKVDAQINSISTKLDTQLGALSAKLDTLMSTQSERVRLIELSQSKYAGMIIGVVALLQIIAQLAGHYIFK